MKRLFGRRLVLHHRVRDGEPALRARGLPGPRRLHQEHDHGRAGLVNLADFLAQQTDALAVCVKYP